MKLFVGNLSWNTGEVELREATEVYGNVEDVHIVTDRETGRSRGFGFVKFTERDQALDAIENLNGALLDGRNLNVNEARERQPRQHANAW
ncbi:RNA recognition motif domain-containing protein [Acanthopleuribacter pedis]|uniref:RRM domain-containing protein n=1 Tax=Acanthopleuribacter pedis TaxID=442870 RepID=A0A8J7Q7B0_9BACT|nr:RNA-binding protein [Acanthopleuribacter pedis]MBO1318109.1 hypothetical protein [Acanthopleuribacter pedis]